MNYRSVLCHPFNSFVTDDFLEWFDLIADLDKSLSCHHLVSFFFNVIVGLHCAFSDKKRKKKIDEKTTKILYIRTKTDSFNH